jgi:flagellar biogenesis protein FliO
MRFVTLGIVSLVMVIVMVGGWIVNRMSQNCTQDKGYTILAIER